MSYLYGDSSPSELQTNFIDFLRDALGYSVQVLEADQRIRDGEAQAVELQRAADAEVARLEALGATVSRAVDGAQLGEAESATARCAEGILRAAADRVRAEIDRVRESVSSEALKLQAAAARQREGCVGALATLLQKHDLPDMVVDMRLEQQGGARYQAWLHARNQFGLSATMQIDVPPTHLLAHVLRLDKLVKQLEVQAPEGGGWLRKEVKLRPQRLDKDYLTELTIGPSESLLKLRANPDGSGAGFDVVVRGEAPRVRLLRPGESEPFDLAEPDAAKIVELQQQLVAGCGELVHSRKGLTEAKLDDMLLKDHPQPRLVVERLLQTIAPTVKEIARRSLTPSELVLKRQLGDGRREEIFVSREELRQKLAPLNDEQRALFAPLGLNGVAAAAPQSAQPATVPLVKRKTPTPTDKPKEPAKDAAPADKPTLDLSGEQAVAVIDDLPTNPGDLLESKLKPAPAK
jgi:hypothetical protein